MTLITDITNLINEHGSSVILKQRLEFLRDQITALEKEKDALKAENKALKSDIEIRNGIIEDQKETTHKL